MKAAGLQKVTHKFGGLLVKNSPVILTGISVAGLIATAALAVKATPKALEILNSDRSTTDDTMIDVVKLTWRCYVPAALMGLVTIGCIVSANTISLRRNAALISVYSLSEAALKEYQAKVIETIGAPKARKIKDDIAKDRITNNPVGGNEVVVTGCGEALCYDALSGRYFKSDIEHIRQAINKVSRHMMTDTFVTLNEVYDELNLKSTKMGENIGWHIDDGLIEPDFSSQLTETGTPCLVLDYVTEPRYNYNNY